MPLGVHPIDREESRLNGVMAGNKQRDHDFTRSPERQSTSCNGLPAIRRLSEQ